MNSSDKIQGKQESRSTTVETSRSGPGTLSALLEQYSVTHDNDRPRRKSTGAVSAKRHSK